MIPVQYYKCPHCKSTTWEYSKLNINRCRICGVLFKT